MTVITPNILLPSETILKVDHESGKTLAEVAHLQARISAKQARHDYMIPVSAVPLAFFPAEDGGAVAVLGNDKVKVTKAAFRQLSSQLEVGGLGRMLEATAHLDSTAKWRGQEARAFEAANLMLRMWSQRVSKTLRWRVCSRRINGEVVRVLDGVVTENYVPLSNADALGLAVDHFGGDRNVVEYRLTTNEMRVRIADEPIDYPYVTHPDVLVVLFQEAYALFGKQLKPGGVLIVEEDLVRLDDSAPPASLLPATRMAEELGNRIVTNVIVLGFLVGRTGVVSRDAAEQALRATVKPKALDLNLRAFEAGFTRATAAAGSARP